MRFNIRSKLLLGFFAVLAIMAVLSVVSYMTESKLSQSSKWVEHTYQVLEKAEETLLGLVNMETGFRGFLLAGKDEFLDPYRNGKAMYTAALIELAKLTSDNPAQLTRWADITKLASDYHAKWTEPGITLRKNVENGIATIQEAADYEASGGGKQYMDGIRVILATAEQIERDLLNKRSAEAATATTLGLNIIIWGTAIAVLAGVIIALMLARSLSSAARQMATVAEGIANGDLTQKITVKSRDEMGEIAVSLTAVIDNVSSLITESEMLTKAAVEGRLSTRGDAGKFKGGYHDIVAGVNKTLDSVIGPLNVAANYVDRISKGDIPPKITDTYNGDFNTLKNNLNVCVDAVAALVDDASMLAQAAVEGRLQTRADATKHQGDFKKIVDGVNRTLDLVIDPINETIAILKRMAEGDLTPTMTGDYKGDFDVLKTALNDTLAAINDLLGQVTKSVEQVTSGSQQVSQASQSLSQGATEQASSLEEITSSITEIAGQTKQNTENAVQVNGLAKKARDDAEQGNIQMKDLVSAMTDINSSAEEIRKIVKAIDDISFQINLLALNANVEAARAGKYGKGFAVVAEEVRNLAVRSAGSVQETTKMVDEAISNIARGNGLVDVTAKQLQSIVGGAGQVASLAEEVATAGKEQSQGLDQISTGLNQIDQVTQANTASAEESASAAEELSSQSQQLKAMLAKFKLAAREQRLSNDDVMRMLQTEMGRQGLANRSGITLRRDAAPAPQQAHQAHPALAASTAGKPGRKPVNPADVIALDDDDFGKF